MQHTLIPLHERIALRREYRTRVVIVFLFAISISIAIGLGALFPAFAQVSLEERQQLETIASLKKGKDTSGISGIESEFGRDRALVNSLLIRSAPFSYSRVVEDVIRIRGQVKIRAISVEQVATTTLAIIIQGIAPTRDALLAYHDRLENQAFGNSVDLPISELAKSKDIPFSLKLTETMP